MRTVLFALSLSILLSCNNSAKLEYTIESADVAYNQLDLKKSRTILNAMLKNDSLDHTTKCKVLQRLAHQDWKYFKDYSQAKNRALHADSLACDQFETWMILSRIERESKHFQEALLSAERAENYAESEKEKDAAKLAYAQAVYDFSINNLKLNTSVDTAMLEQALNILVGMLETNVGKPKPSKLLLGIALLRNNGANVLKAWKSYFHIQDISRTQPYLANAATELSSICSTWEGQNLSLEKQEQLILALASSRFYEFVGNYALKNQNSNEYIQNVNDVLAYSKYLSKVKKETDEYYRQIAIGEESERTYKKWLNDTRKELWQSLSFLSDKEYSESNFLKETKKRFGARGFTGGTGNYSGYVLCFARRLREDELT